MRPVGSGAGRSRREAGGGARQVAGGGGTWMGAWLVAGVRGAVAIAVYAAVIGAAARIGWPRFRRGSRVRWPPGRLRSGQRVKGTGGGAVQRAGALPRRSRGGALL